jgi:RND family efflux transporter MFP subunit
MSFRTAVATGALLAAALAGCNRGSQGVPGPGAFPPAVVKLEAAHPAPIEDTTEYIALLKSLHSTAVQPQIDGQVTGVFVKSGDRVTQGQRLVQIDPSRQQAAVASQEAERAAREADVAFARQQFERASQLLSAGAISKRELEQAETSLRTAEARLQSLQAQVREQQVQLRYFTVSAPTAGVVGDVPVRVGNQVSPQTLLTTIDQNDTLELNVQVPIERAAALRNGLPIRILSNDGETPVVTTSVNFISPRVDDQTQSVLVKALVPNPSSALRASQSVRAQIVWKTAEGLVVPVTAALRINGQYFAFVAEEAKGPDGKGALVARQRAIKVGPIAGETYSVVEGLKPGDRVVVSGVQKLADGAPIAAQQQSP